MENVQRRLASILAADVVGYSSLMEDDEDKTVRSLQGCRGVFDRIIENFGGRIITTAGGQRHRGVFQCFRCGGLRNGIADSAGKV